MASKYLLRTPPERSPQGETASLVEDEPDEEASDDEEHILCRACFRVLTREAERISVDSAHTHIFANPHGIVFEIGCFRMAEGCGCLGRASDVFSWFKGSSWRIAVCRACLAHVGWLFTGHGRESFYGLILDRLLASG